MGIKIRNRYIDIVKGLLIIVVVLRHVFQSASSNSDIDYLCNLMAIVEMPLFIALSGYFCLPKLTSENQMLSVLVKFKKITIAYLVPFFSYYIIFRLFFYQYYKDMDSIFDIFSNISLSLWYLFVIWILNIFALIGYHITKKYFKKGYLNYISFIVIFLGLVGIFLFIGIKTNINFGGCKLAVYYSVYYLLGYLFKCFEDEVFVLYNRFKEVLVFISYIVYFFGSARIKVMAVPDNGLFIILRTILALAGIVVFLSVTYAIYCKSSCKYIEKIGVRTLEIYYVHSFLMNILDVEKTSLLMSTGGIINVLILTMFVCIGCYSIISIINVNAITAFVIFGKTNRTR